MRTSESIDLLCAALSKAQARIKPAEKNATNPHFKSKFANEESVHAAAQTALGENDLSVIQGGKVENGQWIMVTRISHKSGQWIESDFPMLATQMTPQAAGSASSYARRYSYLGMVGVVAGDDDDGEIAQGRGDAKPKDATANGVSRDQSNNNAQKSQGAQAHSKAQSPKGAAQNSPIPRAIDPVLSAIGAEKFSAGQHVGKTIEQVFFEELTTNHGWAKARMMDLKSGKKLPEIALRYIDYAKSMGADLYE